MIAKINMDDILQPLVRIIHQSNTLLLDTDFNDLQRKFIHTIYTSSTNLRDLFLSILDLQTDSLREFVSFETRSSLASIIGYAEELLDEEEGKLSSHQREVMFEIRTDAKQIEAIFDEVANE